jgi:hypothetical protein
VKYNYLAITNKNNVGKALKLSNRQMISIDVYLMGHHKVPIKEFMLRKSYFLKNKRFIRFNIDVTHRDYKDMFYYI